MEINTLQELLSSDIKKAVDTIVLSKDAINVSAVKQYNIINHDVLSPILRPYKKVSRNAYGENGEKLFNSDGTDQYISSLQDVTRLPLPVQKHIVGQRISFLLGNPIERDASAVTEIEEKLLEVIDRTWENNKIDTLLKKVLEKMMSETEVAVICYPEDADEDYWYGTANEGKEQKIRLQILNSDEGESLFPIWDKYGDMIAFARSYKLKNDDQKEIDHFDIYTAELNTFYEKIDGNWLQITTTTNIDNKIPIGYFSQPDVEWADVQRLIDRRSKLASNLGDTNDYFGSPTAVYTGEVGSLPQKDESGKAIQLTGDGADVKYLTWEQSPASIELEIKQLDKMIGLYTGTTDITLEQMTSIGAFSGFAIKMLFLNSHLKASEKETEFSPGVKRLINLLKSMLCAINTALRPAKNMRIDPKFTYFLPRNEQEELDNLIKAQGAGILSTETATIKNPLVQDGGAEFEKIQAEKEAAAPPEIPVPKIGMTALPV